MTDASKSTGMPLPDALAGNFQDAIRWFNQLWSGSPEPSATTRGGVGALPSMMMPTLDVNELEKRITDLRSVEQWLNLNLNLLRTTIQGLEMQRSTLAAWQSLGTPATGTTGSAKAENAAASAAPESPTFQPAMWWAALQQQFAQMAASAAAQAAGATSAQSGVREDASSPAEVPPSAAKPQSKAKTSGAARS
ncbi:MAG TPA: PhaM family polyhydroxyalkanoate granule multifunctional regulatory protein [Burkholderiaceae bacterium]|nr:PhaM family polyhydroxyalkanoate granule multifunctional regulatory protein [Burkholderiaceae bacterium]